MAASFPNPAPDLNEIREGDTVHIQMTVRSNPWRWGPRRLVLVLDGGDVAVPIESIVAHVPRPRPFQVGDRVRIQGKKQIIRALCRDRAWCEEPGDIHHPMCTYQFSELTLDESDA